MKAFKFFAAATLTLVLAAPVSASPIGLGVWNEFLWISNGTPGTAIILGGFGLTTNPAVVQAPDPSEASLPFWSFQVGPDGSLTVVAGDAGAAFSVVEVADDGTFASLIGLTPVFEPANLVAFCLDPVLCMVDPLNFSFASFPIDPGARRIHINTISESPFGAGAAFFRVDAAAVPEPSTLVLLGSGLTLLATRFRRKSRQELTH